MKNFVQAGDNIEVTAPAGGVVSGAGVLVGNLFGIAVASAAAGSPVNVSTRGVFTLPKLSSEVITVGAQVSWHVANGNVVLPGAGAAPIGVAVAAAGNGTTTVTVRLDGASTAAA